MNNKLKTIEMIFRFMDDETKEEVNRYLIDSYKKDYIELKNEEQVTGMFGEKINVFLDNLTESKVKDLRSYTGYNYRNINAVLRNNWNYEINGQISDEKVSYYKDMASNISETINLFPCLDYDFKTFRGVSISYFKDYGINNVDDLKSLVGKYMYEEGFTSTSIMQKNDFFKKDNELGINYNVRIIYNIDGSYNDGALLYNDFLTYSVNQSEYIINKCSLSYVNDVVINEDDKTAMIYVTLIPSKIWDVYTKVNKNENRLSV